MSQEPEETTLEELLELIEERLVQSADWFEPVITYHRLLVDGLRELRALPAKWRECEGQHCERCADELEAALRV